MSITPKQRRFVEEFCVDFNATQAAIRAGYSERSAHNQGGRLIKNDEIARAIAEEQDRLTERTRVTRERVIKELARVGFSDMRSYVEWGPQGVKLKESSELTSDESAAVTEVSESYGENGRTLKFKLGHKDSALKLLAQHTGVSEQDRDPAAAARLYLDLYDKALGDVQDRSEA